MRRLRPFAGPIEALESTRSGNPDSCSILIEFHLDKGGKPQVHSLSATLFGKTTAPAYLDNHCTLNRDRQTIRFRFTF